MTQPRGKVYQDFLVYPRRRIGTWPFASRNGKSSGMAAALSPALRTPGARYSHQEPAYWQRTHLHL